MGFATFVDHYYRSVATDARCKALTLHDILEEKIKLLFYKFENFIIFKSGAQRAVQYVTLKFARNPNSCTGTDPKSRQRSSLGISMHRN